MSEQEELTVPELLEIGSRMAQELLEFIEAGEEGGSDMTGPRSLLEEREEMYKLSQLDWQQQIAITDSNDDCPLLASIL